MQLVKLHQIRFTILITLLTPLYCQEIIEDKNNEKQLQPALNDEPINMMVGSSRQMPAIMSFFDKILKPIEDQQNHLQSELADTETETLSKKKTRKKKVHKHAMNCKHNLPAVQLFNDPENNMLPDWIMNSIMAIPGPMNPELMNPLGNIYRLADQGDKEEKMSIDMTDPRWIQRMFEVHGDNVQEAGKIQPKVHFDFMTKILTKNKPNRNIKLDNDEPDLKPASKKIKTGFGRVELRRFNPKMNTEMDNSEPESDNDLDLQNKGQMRITSTSTQNNNEDTENPNLNFLFPNKLMPWQPLQQALGIFELPDFTSAKHMQRQGKMTNDKTIKGSNIVLKSDKTKFDIDEKGEDEIQSDEDNVDNEDMSKNNLFSASKKDGYTIRKETKEEREQQKNGIEDIPQASKTNIVNLSFKKRKLVKEDDENEEVTTKNIGKGSKLANINRKLSSKNKNSLNKIRMPKITLHEDSKENDDESEKDKDNEMADEHTNSNLIHSKQQNTLKNRILRAILRRRRNALEHDAKEKKESKEKNVDKKQKPNQGHKMPKHKKEKHQHKEKQKNGVEVDGVQYLLLKKVHTKAAEEDLKEEARKEAKKEVEEETKAIAKKDSKVRTKKHKTPKHQKNEGENDVKEEEKTIEEREEDAAEDETDSEKILGTKKHVHQHHHDDKEHGVGVFIAIFVFLLVFFIIGVLVMKSVFPSSRSVSRVNSRTALYHPSATY